MSEGKGSDTKKGQGRADVMLLAVGVVLLLLLIGLVVYGGWWRDGTAQPGATEGVTGSTVERAVGSTAAGAAHFVGSATCAGCHAKAYQDWLGSHHQLAMQPASADSVLGDFSAAPLAQGDGAAFSRAGDQFVIRTTGPDGKQHDYPVRYTFGVYPLQQYLLGLPGGRLQTFGTAWDSRPADEGGQRWFALYPESGGNPESPLHWAAIDQNWNGHCSHCHSTDLHKQYDATTHQYATSYAEVSVGCEACHGPGSAHVAWARAPSTAIANRGLTVNFGAQPLGRWHYDQDQQLVVGQGPGNQHREVETCARCHGLGTPLDEQSPHGQPVGDSKRIALLDPALYFVDGQIKGEVFEYGSFMQSRMYHEGVTCSNCHNPHSGQLRAKGNAVCTQCHQASRYDTPQHHHHPVDSAGAQCVACHMPSRTYMKVDVRHDHSLRVPRPDLSVRLGTPNACNQCHQDQSPAWAAAQIKSWPNGAYHGFQHFAEALWAGREDAPGARRKLVELIGDKQQPAIARATALRLLLDRGEGNAANKLIQQAARDPSPLVRRAAAGWPGVAPSLLNDAVRSVRLAAAETLAPQGGPRSASALPPELRKSLQAGLDQYRATQALSADRPEAHLALARLHASQGDAKAALAELQTALKLDPAFVPAAVNLADFYRAQGQDQNAEKVLRRTLQRVPDASALHYALGLLAVRQGHSAQALAQLADAQRLAPDNPQYAYVYALALSGNRDTERAIQVLESSLQQHPWHRPSLATLAKLYQQQGNHAQAMKYQQRLQQWQKNE